MEVNFRADALAHKALIMAVCIGMSLLARADFGTAELVAFLSALSCTSLAEWLLTRHPTYCGVPTLVFSALSMLVPSFAAFLPVTAYDAGRMLPSSERSLPATGGQEPGRGTVWFMRVERWSWAAALVAMFIVAISAGPGSWLPSPINASAGAVVSHARLMPILLALFTTFTFLAGAAAARSGLADTRLRAVQDQAREMRRRRRKELIDSAAESMQSARRATLNERARIAREIHDNVGHLLTRAIMQTQAASVVARTRGDEETDRSLSELQESLDEAMTMVRRSVHDLDDQGTDFEALIGSATHAMDSLSPDFSVDVENDIRDTPAPVARCLASVIREALSNVVRHTDAHKATVVLRDYPALWQLVVFNRLSSPSSASPTHAETLRRNDDMEGLRGMGLADIDARARALGGTSLCGPYDGGWRVFISIPKTPWDTQNGDRPQ